MNIDLDQLQSAIDSTIYKRGVEVYKSGAVEQLEVKSEGRIRAEVNGTNRYQVTIQIKDETVFQHHCTCPYVFGPVCKHIVAVLLGYTDKIAGIDAPHPPKARKERKPRKTAVEKEMDQVVELLNRISKDELQQFLLDYGIANKEFRSNFIMAFASKSSGESKAIYVKQIKHLIQKYSGPYKFIDYRSSLSLAKSLYPVVHLAEKSFEEGNYHMAISIASALLETIVPLFNHADDSSGSLSSHVVLAMAMLKSMASSELPEELRLEVFQFTTTACRKGWFSGWDWHLECMEVAALVAKPGKEAKEVKVMLEKELIDSSEYMLNEVEGILIALLRRTDPEALHRFMNEQESSPAVQEELIRLALEANDLAGARALADAALTKAEAGGERISVWLEWLLRISDAEGDRRSVATYARRLFLEVNSDQKRWLAVMRNNIEENAWADFVYELIAMIDAQDRFYLDSVIASLYAMLGDWDQLFVFLKEKEDSGRSVNHLFVEYESDLKPDYADEIAAIYESTVRSHLEQASKRSIYASACVLIRRMKKLGATDRAERLIADLRNAYPQRIALMDELDMV